MPLVARKPRGPRMPPGGRSPPARRDGADCCEHQPRAAVARRPDPAIAAEARHPTLGSEKSMAKKAAFITVHGMGSAKESYNREVVAELRDRLGARLASGRTSATSKARSPAGIRSLPRRRRFCREYRFARSTPRDAIFRSSSRRMHRGKYCRSRRTTLSSGTTSMTRMTFLAGPSPISRRNTRRS